MNASKRLLLGVVSTLLLAAGFARAADRFDPMNHASNPSQADTIVADGPALPCTGGGGTGGDGGDGYN